jgi:dihydrofolate reductase
VSRLIISTFTSTDGYMSGRGGDLSQLPFESNESFSRHNLQLLEGAGTHLFGAKSFAGMVQYWPAVANDPDQPQLEHDIAARNAVIDKVVVSDTLTADDTDPWRDTTKIVRRVEALDHIAKIREGDDGDIVMFGSGILANHLMAAGLVDEVQLLVGAGIIADGIPAFVAPPSRPLTLVDVSRLPGSSDTALLRYSIE